MLPDALIVVQRLVRAWNELGIEYLIGGSVASSLLGIFRATNDVDFVVVMNEMQIAPLVSALQGEFYIDDEMILDAIQTQTSFSVLHLPTVVKADVFIRKSDAWAEEVWRRRQRVTVGSENEEFSILIAAPEDMILQKLAWFRQGGGVSDRQWNDVLGMIQVQSPTLDRDYLQQWAKTLELTELLNEALTEAEAAMTPPEKT